MHHLCASLIKKKIIIIIKKRKKKFTHTSKKKERKEWEVYKRNNKLLSHALTIVQEFMDNIQTGIPSMRNQY